MDSDSEDRYQARGVSSTKDEVRAAIASIGKGLFPGAFCRIARDLSDIDSEHCTILHSDDVGTKTALAYLAWKEGLGLDVWRGIAQDSLVMNLDDCACAGAVDKFLIVNTIARNAKLISGEVVETIINGYEVMVRRLAECGIECALVGGETSDCGDIVRTVFVESSVVTRLRRDEVVDASRMRPGDLLVSFASDGQAVWEIQPNSGIGSNGLTSARHDTLKATYRERYPETFSPEIDERLVYCGQFSLDDQLPGDDRFTVASALLSPTRTYLPLLRRLLRTVPAGAIHGLVHCTGGGQTKIVNFGGTKGVCNRYVKDALLPIPPVFRMLQAASGQRWREMYKVFNMGQLLEVAVVPEIANECIALAKEFGVEAVVSGHIEKASGDVNEVVIHGEGGEHVFLGTA